MTEKKELLSPAIKTYVMRAGRMTSGQKRNYEVLKPKFCLNYEKKMLNFKKLFDNYNPVVIEIGFGMGDATAIIAKEHPEINYIAIDVFKAGVGKLLGKIEEFSLSNLKIIEYDAIQVLENMIENESIKGFHIFFPDPWQKKRHHKRRLLQKKNIDLMTEKMNTGGYIYMVTDWEDYAYYSLNELKSVNSLNSHYAEFAEPQKWRPKTNFEEKALKKGHKIFELFFSKKC